MKVYHGSKNNFELFDYSKIRTNGTTEGVGFYCTDNFSIAKHYSFEGYIMEYEYIGKKTLDSKKVSLTRNELEKYILKLNEECEFLSNFGDIEWEGFDKVLNGAIDDIMEFSEDDIDIVSELCTICGEFELPLKVLYDTLGYDSSIIDADWGKQRIYLIFDNSALRYLKTIKYEEAC